MAHRFNHDSRRRHFLCLARASSVNGPKKERERFLISLETCSGKVSAWFGLPMRSGYMYGYSLLHFDSGFERAHLLFQATVLLAHLVQVFAQLLQLIISFVFCA